MFEVGIVGGSGYTGLELLRLLAGHPQVRVTTLTSRNLAGQRLDRVFPALAGRAGGLGDLVFEHPDPQALAAKAQMVFMAVPHRTAMETAPELIARGLKVVDLSADFRYDDPEVYAAWYEPHQAPELLAESVYGLPELHRERIKTARLVGNPGCYTTCAILAGFPLIHKGLVEPTPVIVDAKSGVSGAGRGTNLTSQFCEINDGIMAYKITGHRHTSEMEQELSRAAGTPVTVVFTPHLAPFSRGILSVVYLKLKPEIGQDEADRAVRDFYRDEPFVRVREPGGQPHTLDVRGTNFCDLGVFVDQRAGMVKVVSVIDNLTRGASGQAVCNMNLMLGLPEDTGLTMLGLRP